LLQAGIDRALGRPRGEEPWLRRAIDQAGVHGLALFKAAAEVGVAEGGAEAGAESGAGVGAGWMTAEGVRAPRALARMIAPGLVS
jgi:hypothetical protein